MNIRGMKSPLRRFMNQLSPRPNGCVLWTGATSGRYGSLNVNGRRKKAHRFSYAAFVGDLDEDMIVRHRCDTPLCVNPEHLLVGTQADNIHDMWERGRQSRPPDNRSYKCGQRQHWRKFTDAQIDEVKRRLGGGESQRMIGLAVGMSQQHVSQISRGVRRAGV